MKPDETVHVGDGAYLVDIVKIADHFLKLTEQE